MSTFILTLRKTTMKLLFRQTIPYINRRHNGGTRISSSSSSSSDCTFSTDATTTVDKFQKEVISILEGGSYILFIDESIYHDTIIPKFMGGMLYKDIESGKDPNHKCHTWELRPGICHGMKGTLPSMQGQLMHTWRCKKCGVSRTFTNEFDLDPATLVQWLLEQDFQNGGCCCASSD